MLDINLERETEDAAIYIHTSRPGVSQVNGPDHEKRIDAKYLDNSTRERAFRLETYRSQGTVSLANPTQLRCYFVAKCEFVNPNPNEEASHALCLGGFELLTKVYMTGVEGYSPDWRQDVPVQGVRAHHAGVSVGDPAGAAAHWARD